MHSDTLENAPDNRSTEKTEVSTEISPAPVLWIDLEEPEQLDEEIEFHTYGWEL